MIGIKVIKSDLNGYYENRTNFIENDFFSKKIKLGQMNYYRITYKDGEFIMSLYLDNNSKAIIRHYRDNLIIPNLYEKLMYELSKTYKSIKLEVDNNDIDTINIIKEKSNVIREIERNYKEYKFTIFDIDLTSIDTISTNDDFNIKKYTYEEFLELQYKEIKKSNVYKEIKNGKTKFYRILDDDNETIDTFTVTTARKQNDIYLREETIVTGNVLNLVIKELSKDYKSVVFNIFDTSTEALNKIKEICPKVEDITPNIISGIGMINLKIEL